jgi:hypothetical protein
VLWILVILRLVNKHFMLPILKSWRMTVYKKTITAPQLINYDPYSCIDDGNYTLQSGTLLNLTSMHHLVIILRF